MTITQVSFKDANSWVEVYDSQLDATTADLLELLSYSDHVIASTEWAERDFLNTRDLYGFTVIIHSIKYPTFGQKFIIHTSIAREKAWIDNLFLTLKHALHSTSKDEIVLYCNDKTYKLRLKKQ